MLPGPCFEPYNQIKPAALFKINLFNIRITSLYLLATFIRSKFSYILNVKWRDCLYNSNNYIQREILLMRFVTSGG